MSSRPPLPESCPSPVTDLPQSVEPHFRLWDELADLSAGNISQALCHCMDSLCESVQADNAFWLGLVRMDTGPQSRDPYAGWRIRCAEVLKPEHTSSERMQKGLQLLHQETPSADAQAVMADAGTFRVHSLGTGVLDLESFMQTEHYDFFFRQKNINDRIWVVFPVNEDVESCFMIDTHTPDRFFTESELNRIATALRGVKWFHRRLLLSHGLGISEQPLTPAERRLLPELLAGDTEKVIADRIGLTQPTVHQYATSIYRKFDVRGRTEFMAIWLKGRF